MWLKCVPFIPGIKILLLDLKHFLFDSNKLVEEDALNNIFKVLKTIQIQHIDLWSLGLPQKLQIN
jgi:hypothetical protein